MSSSFMTADFRVGGLDIGRCGPRGKLIYRIETRYHDIIPGQRIVSTEVASEGQHLLSFALITVEFDPVDGGTRLVLTDQVAAYGGASMIDGHRAGYEAALDNLRAELAAETPGT